MRAEDSHVGADTIDGHYISTVWLGLDITHRPPLIIETMIFCESADCAEYDCPLHHWMERYPNETEARAGHEAAKLLVMALLWARRNTPEQGEQIAQRDDPDLD